jgi:hypothetical protein
LLEDGADFLETSRKQHSEEKQGVVKVVVQAIEKAIYA